ncbi:MAG: glycerate kinase [Clostridiales bacterium]|nr:glycerate kinase [Clostridiales bacterium]
MIAPDSFKGSLTAEEAGAAIMAGVRRALPDAETVVIPMSDGGDGMLRALMGGDAGPGGITAGAGGMTAGPGGITAGAGGMTAGPGGIIECEAEDPLGRPIKALYGMMRDGTAVIEMAQASGLTLLSEDERDPLLASTYGTGMLIRDAMDRGARDIILGIGGSATNDGGAGMAQALGYRLLDNNNEELPRGGGALIGLARIDASSADIRLAQSRFTAACDVDNPLTGKYGASAVFGPQKGATPDMAALLDRALKRFAGCVLSDLGKDVEKLPGGGAAGGLGAGCIAFLGARLRRGVDIVAEAAGLAKETLGAALVITGEGRTDSQTPGGKTVHGVSVLAQGLGVPVLVISGSLADGADEMLKYGVVRLYALMEGGVTLDEAMRDGEKLLEARAERAAREYFGIM